MSDERGERGGVRERGRSEITRPVCNIELRELKEKVLVCISKRSFIDNLQRHKN